MLLEAKEVIAIDPELDHSLSLAMKVSELVDPEVLYSQYREASDVASQKTEGRSFQNGVNFFGNAEAYNLVCSVYGPDSDQAREARQVLRNDMATLILEEVSLKNYFSADYDIWDGKAYAAGVWLGEQYARPIVAGIDAPDWMTERFLVELEEQLSLEQLISSGKLEDRTMITLSPSPFGLGKKDLEDYQMERNFLMIRFLSLDKTGAKLNISQLQIPQDLITEADLRSFLESLDVEPNNDECIDPATNILRSSFLMNSETLGSKSNILRALDLHVSDRVGQPLYCGQKISYQPNIAEYDQFVASCMKRYAKFESAIDYAVRKITEQSAAGNTSAVDIRTLSRDIKKRALSLMNDTEIRSNYGDVIADAYIAGGYEAARLAGLKDHFSSGSCPGVLGAEEDSLSSDSDAYCESLPEPGDKARCPSCKKIVVVTGTKDNIRCSNGKCDLADDKSRAAYLAAKKSGKKVFSAANKKTSKRKSHQKTNRSDSYASAA